MKIKNLHLKNFRCFEDFEIEFNTGDQDHGGLTVLVAKNGEGKTAILDAINIAWGAYFRKMPLAKGAIFHKDDRKNGNDPKEMESYGYTSLKTSFITPANDITIQRTYYLDKNGKARTTVKDSKELEAFAKWCLDSRFEKEFFLPLLAYYGDDRLLSDFLTEEESKPLMYQDRALGYSGANNRKGDFKSFYKWYVDLWRSLMDQQLKQLNQKVSFNAEALNYYKMLDELVSSSIRDALDVTGWNKLDYDNGEKVLYVLNSKTKEKANIKSLSAGNRIVLAVVGDLVHRASVLNRFAGMDILKKTPGIVLIDEIELHLHPSWQQQILPTLQKIFPKIQFIVTTHSPQVVSSVPTECIRIIDNGNVYGAKGSEGADSSRILKRVFGTESFPENNEQRMKLKKYLDLVYAKQWNTPEALELRRSLNSVFNGEEPLLDEADLFIENEQWELAHPEEV